MSLPVLLQLARPRSATDRRRTALLTMSIGLAGAFLLAGWRVQRLGFSAPLDSPQYGNYMREDGLRGGVAVATVLLAIAACALTYQALKLGTAARDRRLSALRLAGATPRQVRAIGAAEAGLAGLAGGLLAGPLYFVLSGLIQLLPRMARVLPPPTATDLLTWVVMILLLTAAATAVGRTLRRGVIIEPLTAVPDGTQRRRPALVVGAVGLLVSGFSLFLLFGGNPRGSYRQSPAALYLCLILLLGGVIVAAAALSPVLLDRMGHRMSASADPLKMLAGGRLSRTARSAGRTVTLLVVCGIAVGCSAVGLASAFRERAGAREVDVMFGDSLWFVITGFGLTMAAALFTAVVAGVALLAGAVDDLLDQRRQFAYLSVFGVGESQLRQSIRHQLTSTVTPALAVGLLAGCLFFRLYGRGPMNALPLLWVLLIVAGGTGLAWLAAAGAARLLGAQIRDAIDPVNLRAP